MLKPLLVAASLVLAPGGAKAADHVLRLSDDDLRVIADALDNTPYKAAAPVVAHLSRQLKDEQDAAASHRQGSGPPTGPSSTDRPTDAAPVEPR